MAALAASNEDGRHLKSSVAGLTLTRAGKEPQSPSDRLPLALTRPILPTSEQLVARAR